MHQIKLFFFFFYRSGSQPPKRHVRKNPLIVPSAMVSNLIRNENVSTCLYGSSASNTKSSPLRHYNPSDQDAFETALEENMDALDNIGGEGGEESLFLDESTPGKRFKNSTVSVFEAYLPLF